MGDTFRDGLMLMLEIGDTSHPGNGERARAPVRTLTRVEGNDHCIPFTGGF